MKKITLREARNRRGLRASFVITKLGISRVCFYNYESGKSRIPAAVFLGLTRLYMVNPYAIDLEGGDGHEK